MMAAVSSPCAALLSPSILKNCSVVLLIRVRFSVKVTVTITVRVSLSIYGYGLAWSYGFTLKLEGKLHHTFV